MKTRTKSVIILMITLFTVIMIGTTKVNAVEITDEVWNAIPNEISVNVKEIEYEKAEDIIKSQVIEILKGKGITATKEEVSVSISIDSRKVNITIENKQKEFKLVLSNSADYRKSEQQKVDNIIKGINTNIVITPELSEMLKEEKEMEKDPENYNTMYSKTVEKALSPLKEAGYTLVECGGYGGGDVFSGEGGTKKVIYKNDVYYGLIGIEVQTQGKLTIPSYVEDTETAIINYATPKIEEFLKETIHADGLYKEGDGIVLKKYDGDYYRVSNKRTQELIGTVLLKKEPTTTTTKEDTTTGIKVIGTLESTVVLESKKVEEKQTLDTVKKALPQTTYQCSVYDINLLRDGAKIQPNGKVKVSIPIPSGYNKERLTIYRVDENGTSTEYKVKVEENYATFETDHFSIYVLAEKKAETTTTTTPTAPTTNKGEKDNTPKTGTADITKYIVAVAVISAVGIMLLKKKETK